MIIQCIAVPKPWIDLIACENVQFRLRDPITLSLIRKISHLLFASYILSVVYMILFLAGSFVSYVKRRTWANIWRGYAWWNIDLACFCLCWAVRGENLATKNCG